MTGFYLPVLDFGSVIHQGTWLTLKPKHSHGHCVKSTLVQVVSKVFENLQHFSSTAKIPKREMKSFPFSLSRKYKRCIFLVLNFALAGSYVWMTSIAFISSCNYKLTIPYIVPYRPQKPPKYFSTHKFVPKTERVKEVTKYVRLFAIHGFYLDEKKCCVTQRMGNHESKSFRHNDITTCVHIKE